MIQLFTLLKINWELTRLGRQTSTKLKPISYVLCNRNQLKI